MYVLGLISINNFLFLLNVRVFIFITSTFLLYLSNFSSCLLKLTFYFAIHTLACFSIYFLRFFYDYFCLKFRFTFWSFIFLPYVRPSHPSLDIFFPFLFFFEKGPLKLQKFQTDATQNGSGAIRKGFISSCVPSLSPQTFFFKF